MSRPGGIVCYHPDVVYGGPYFAALRERILLSASVPGSISSISVAMFSLMFLRSCVVVLERMAGRAQPRHPEALIPNRRT